ncbi:MAG: hypothetical protein ACM3MD_10430 [Betaproteobacteria bacterium]
MLKKTTITTLMGKYQGRFSVQMGIDLSSGKPDEIFKWFFASVLFGARISETIVNHTYHEMKTNHILSPKVILNTGWDGLVAVLDKGGYVRYDFKTATKLLDLSKNLMDLYGGDLNVLHAAATDPDDLEKKLKSLAKGIGDVTVNIFLREMRGIWEKAKPLPLEPVVGAAQDIGIIKKQARDRRKILELLMKAWKDAGMRKGDFPDFEAALVRLGREIKKKRLQRKPE